MINLPHRILSFFFPHFCVSCGVRTDEALFTHLCPDCAEYLASSGAAIPSPCVKCSAPTYADTPGLCYDCSIGAFSFTRNTSMLSYTHPVIRDMVLSFKFESDKLTGSDLAHLLESPIRDFLNTRQFDVCTAIPLSRQSLKVRGYNQVDYILDRLKIPYTPLLERKEHPTHQSRLSQKERRESVRGQFPLLPDTQGVIRDKKILLIDDIFTTGSTVEEGTATLLAGGAREIEILTFFRA
ncbi:MAG: ComF family protein [Brevinematales bacterium]|nr:ComF family protein [Brevinematales bacterium]